MGYQGTWVLPRQSFGNRLAIVLYACLLFTTACSDSDLLALDGCPKQDQGDAIIGTGIDSFSPLKDGEPMMLTAGFQGGYHIYGSLRLPLDAAGPARIAFNLCQDDTVVALARLNDDIIASGSYSEYLGALVVMVNTFLPGELADKESRFTVAVEDAAGRLHVRSISVTPTCCSSVQGD